MNSFFCKALPLFLILSLNTYAQTELYLPKQIKAAYQKNTRSFDGKPGTYYWQNLAAYNINASINPESKELTGSLKVTYQNNSPDTLKKIVFKLYQNMNRKGAARNVILPEDAVTDGMNITRLIINQNEYDLISPGNMITELGTNLSIVLNEPLLPQNSIDAEIDWNFIIPPSTTPRMGVTDSATFFIAYWYPKIAVYDDIDGWDMHSYNGEHEYYFGYSDFNVNITMPRGYIVWATGLPLNLEDILSPGIMDKYNKALGSDSIIKVISIPDLKGNKIFKGNNENYTWNYYAENVPDFAFGTSAHYVWQMTSVKMNGRKIIAQTAFNPSSESYNEIIKFARGALEQFPDGPQSYPYPYPQITIFNGDSGMEFPMIVNDAAFPNRATDVYVTIHEMTHMFFPFHTAMSETKYGWFDEGMAYFLPQKIQLSFDPSDHRVRAARGYANYAGRENDLPLMTPTFFLREPDLSMLNYYKSAVAFDMLQNLTGEEMFRKCMEEFITLWNGKHPTPYDFFYTFNRVTGENLNWFWQKWFFEKGFPDLAVKSVESGGGKIRILIERIGNYPIPVELSIESPDGRTEKLSYTSILWSDNSTEKWIEAEFTFDPVRVELGAKWIPDSNPSNNIWQQR
jgi:hypothetical protein